VSRQVFGGDKGIGVHDETVRRQSKVGDRPQCGPGADLKLPTA
jgi:hypothetical protein